MVEDLGDDMDLARLADSVPEVGDLLEQEDDAPIIRLINALLAEAIREDASDVHIETFEKDLSVRFRVDGVMREIVRPKRALAPLLVSRIKVMAKLDIAEKRVPQDGRISLRIGGREVDVRVSTLPSANGERVVLRILDKQAERLTLPYLGMREDVLELLREVVRRPHGIFLVTGPTGSGKTTHALCVADRTQHADHEHPHDRGSDRVQPDRNRADPGQRKGGHDLRPGPACDSAPGPRCRHGRRDSRFGNRADRDPGKPHRPPGDVHATHEYGSGSSGPAGGPGCRTVSRSFKPCRGIGAKTRSGVV